MNTLIQLPISPIVVPLPYGNKNGFTQSIFPWHRKCDTNQAKGDAGVAIVLACMQAAGHLPEKINGGGDILLDDCRHEVKFLCEAIKFNKNGSITREWRFNGVRPDQPDWQNLYVVVQQGDHASNEVLVLEFDRESVMKMIEAKVITRYGQQQKGEDGSMTNVIEFRPLHNSRRNEIADQLLPYASSVVTIPQDLLHIIFV